MILSRYDGRLLVVRQPDHGLQTGLIAAAWGNDEVPAVTEHREASRLAAAHHDDGWAIWERHPDLDPHTGQPTQFHQVKPREHVPAYRAGIQRAAQLDPWTELLVSMHGAGLYNDRYGSYRLAEVGEQSLTDTERELVEEFLTDMARLQASLYTEAIGHAPPSAPHALPEVMSAYLLLQVWDRISLQFALRHAADATIAPLPVPGQQHAEIRCHARGRFRLALDPYPFAESSVALPVTASIVPDRPYTDTEDFLATLSSADHTTIECTATRP
ncbi:DUF3891 family protein [Pseudonocardia sp. 73-21]|uniref:DUF3891 family protein n=1 Tax=Pseudonocardia sp. 73-21 TaxID=1895809 RepID=UPI00095EC655|nr:DUF3891 family protein [Pseudonocardia sp. 73-21]OJY43420.1 MAG: hypothetical protein BGP03_10535 [Pseudonocardia sp. 73-21]